MMTVFVISGFVSDIRQIALIIQTRSATAMPVTFLQKKVETLKLYIIRYTRTSFISVPFYPLILIISAKMFFNTDLWAPAYYNYLFVNIIFGIVLLPIFLWLFQKLGKQNLSNPVVKNFLSGSGWNQAVLAQQFLNDIEKFEDGSKV
jgi:hypothetical protein